jgi:hypothetical protein
VYVRGGWLVHFVGDLGIHFVLNLLAGAASSVVGRASQEIRAVLAAVGAIGSAVAEVSAVALHLQFGQSSSRRKKWAWMGLPSCERCREDP